MAYVILCLQVFGMVAAVMFGVCLPVAIFSRIVDGPRGTKGKKTI